MDTLVRCVHRPEYGRVCLELPDFGNARAFAQSEHSIFDGQPGVTEYGRREVVMLLPWTMYGMQFE